MFLRGQVLECLYLNAAESVNLYMYFDYCEIDLSFFPNFHVNQHITFSWISSLFS